MSDAVPSLTPNGIALQNTASPPDHHSDPKPDIGKASALEVFWIFLRLGLTSFGGPVAHLGYFRQAFVVERKWFTDAAYSELVAICQFMPGPASSQTGFAIGLSRAGYLGGLAAWTGFTLPSAIALVAFFYALTNFGVATDAPWLTGLKTVAVAVVAQAVWGMARSLTPDAPRQTLAAAAAALALLMPGVVGQLGAIALGIAATPLLAKAASSQQAAAFRIPVSAGVAWTMLAAFLALLFALPLWAATAGSPAVSLFDSFFRAGALVFGGGHVVLPLLQAELVPAGRVDADLFTAGYGAAQAVPGPLFTFATFLGAASNGPTGGIIGAVIATVAIFLPSLFLVLAILPLWDRMRRIDWVRHSLVGINAAVVGLLAAALYDPVWTSGITKPTDVILALAAFIALQSWNVTPWIVVVASALGAAVFGAIS